MKGRVASLVLPVVGLACFGFSFVHQSQDEKKCEEVYTNIKVFKGVPAGDLIPAMEFMCASLKWQCTNCHDAADYAKDTQAKETARKMVELQRDINTKWFNGRNEVTCMSCHGGEEHPVNLPTPEGVTLRHGRVSNAPKATDLTAKHTAAAGKAPVMLVRTGTLTAPNDATHEAETKELELDVATGGKFRIKSGDRLIVSDGAKVMYGEYELWGEPVQAFQRMAKGWWGDEAFSGLDGFAVSGKDKVGASDVLAVRANRASTGSIEEFLFDTKTGLMARMVNVKRSSIGMVVTSIDYADYKDVQGTQVPMKVTVSFASGEQWAMSFSAAKASDTVDESLFKTGEARNGR